MARATESRVKFHPTDIVPAHRLTTGANHQHRDMLAASRLHKIKTPGKRPEKVENIEKKADTDRQKCPVCGEQKSGCCRCSGPHSMEALERGHGAQCPNGHRWSYQSDGTVLIYKDPAKVENIEKKAIELSTMAKLYVARRLQKRLMRPAVQEEVEQEKQATWLERWLSMYAARDAAHQADPARDSIGTKLLGGPLSLGLSEAVNNRLILGATPEERSDAMHDAAQDVKDESYPQSMLRGLKSSPAYIGVGAAAGAGIPALADKLHGNPVNSGKMMSGAGIGAASGLGLALLRPVLQRAILGNVSRKALNRAIETKSQNPTLTALPLGDVIGATQ
jgi:hypothetical protein